MGRRRSAALRDAAGVYQVASKLALEGFSATVARGSNAVRRPRHCVSGPEKYDPLRSGMHPSSSRPVVCRSREPNSVLT